MTPPADDAVRRLLAAAGRAGPFAVSPLPGGGNNRVYQVDISGGPVLLKAYFRHPDDPRDRLGNEFGFARFAWDRGVRSLPEPLVRDPDVGLGLYEYLDGKPILPGGVGGDDVRAAAEFHRAVNQHRHHPDAAALPIASESGFSIVDHVTQVDRRMARLADVGGSSALDREARDLIDGRLVPAWAAVRQRVIGAEDLVTDRCLSASDFGFHNALRTPAGIRFLDFEYAGWDDPAKLIADFFCQPKVPVDPSHFDAFAAAVAADHPDPPAVVRRARQLGPVCRVKWWCLMLNEFLPVGNQRRMFARGDADRDGRKRDQLARVRAGLDRGVDSWPW